MLSVTDVSEQAVCYRHPDRPTGLSCTECGRPICTACSIDAAVGQRCPECVRRDGPQQVITARQITRRRASFGEAPVTFTIIGIALLIAVLSAIAPAVWNDLGSTLAMWPFGVAQGQWWRMMTVILVHAPLLSGLGIMHVGFNMLITYRLGVPVEREMGSWAFATMYLGTAAAGSALAFYIGPNVPGVGASGAAFGLFGLWLASGIRRRGTTRGRMLIRELGGILVLNAAVPFILPNVAWEAHLGGLLAGLLIGWIWTAKPFVNNTVARTAVAILVLATSILPTQIL